jgi:hypothetical protein
MTQSEAQHTDRVDTSLLSKAQVVFRRRLYHCAASHFVLNYRSSETPKFSAPMAKIGHGLWQAGQIVDRRPQAAQIKLVNRSGPIQKELRMGLLPVH